MSTEAVKPSLRGFDLPALEELMQQLGEQPYRAKQIFAWIHKRRAHSIDAMSDLKRDLRERLAEQVSLAPLQVDAKYVSSDGTR